MIVLRLLFLERACVYRDNLKEDSQSEGNEAGRGLNIRSMLNVPRSIFSFGRQASGFNKLQGGA